MVKHVGIYKITAPDNKVYIGQSRNIFERFVQYRKQRKRDGHLYKSIRNHGHKTHFYEICHYLPSDVSNQVLDIYECLYMDLYKNAGVEMLNIRDGGKCAKNAEVSKLLMRGKRGKRQSKPWSLARREAYNKKMNYGTLHI